MSQMLTTDALIIGSGAGGAAVFRELARAGADVLVVEEGPRIKADELPASVVDRMSLTYRNGGLQPIIGQPMIPFGEGRVLGGTTEVNGGLLWRTPEKVLQRWRSDGFLADYTDTDLLRIAESIEVDLGVGLAPHDPSIDTDSEIIRRAAQERGWKAVQVPRAAPGCLRRNLCASVCPSGAKQSMSQTYLPAGEAYGGRILTDVRVERIKSSGGRALGAVGHDTRTGERVVIRAREVFLAAGALQSPRLLATALDKRAWTSRLGIHLNTKVIAEFPEPLSAQRSTIFTWQVQEFLDDGILVMPANLRPEYLAMALAGADTSTVDRLMDRLDHLALITTQIRPAAYGRIAGAGSASIPLFALTEADAALLARSVDVATQMLFSQGAELVHLPLAGLPTARSHAMALSAIDAARRADWLVTSVHAMSSLPASRNPRHAVDSQGRVRGLRNLHVVDASALPSTVGESPQGTIMLNARATVERLLA